VHGLPFVLTHPPLVTALCLTHTCPSRLCRHENGTSYSRRPWLQKAIRCFQAQTYPNRELLIVADGADIKDLVTNDDRIRLIHIESGYLIGAKRNFGCTHARGSIISHFDDDDWSAPERIADQVQRLQESGKQVTGYHTMLFTNGTEWWRFRGAASHGMGTSLCFRKEWWSAHLFPLVQIGEDGNFVNAAHRAHEFISSDAGELMVASCHTENTSKRQLRSEAYRPLPDFPGVSWSEPLCG